MNNRGFFCAQFLKQERSSLTFWLYEFAPVQNVNGSTRQSNRPVAQLAEAPDLGSGQCEFESHQAYLLHGPVAQLAEASGLSPVQCRFESYQVYNSENKPCWARNCLLSMLFFI